MIGTPDAADPELFSVCPLPVAFAAEETADASGAGFICAVAPDCTAPRRRRNIPVAPITRRHVTVTHAKAILGFGEKFRSAPLRATTCPGNEFKKSRIQDRSLAASSRRCSCADATASFREVAAASEGKGFCNAGTLVTMPGRCPGFPIGATLFRTDVGTTRAAARAFARRLIISGV